MGIKDYGGDDRPEQTKAKVFDEFDCPDCNANNPYDDGIRDGDEIRCYYCGLEYRVKVTDDGKLKLRES